jgi:NAD-dependent dihydropyrimidine dehydrogenase PreA subunit
VSRPELPQVKRRNEYGNDVEERGPSHSPFHPGATRCGAQSSIKMCWAGCRNAIRALPGGHGKSFPQQWAGCAACVRCAKTVSEGAIFVPPARSSIGELDGAELRARARPVLVRPAGEARLGHWAVGCLQRAAGAQPVFDEERHVRLLVRDRENNSTCER